MSVLIAVLGLLAAGAVYLAATRPCLSHHHHHRHLRRARHRWAP